jgi:hypothetical protein
LKTMAMRTFWRRLPNGRIFTKDVKHPRFDRFRAN